MEIHIHNVGKDFSDLVSLLSIKPNVKRLKELKQERDKWKDIASNWELRYESLQERCRHLENKLAILTANSGCPGGGSLG